ncbi:MAG: sulfotransferase [Leptospirillia bacterium]
MNLKALFDKALQHQRSGQLQQAAELCQKILSKQPNNPHALSLLGTLYSQGGHHAHAIEVLKKVVQLDPDDAGAHNSLALSYRILKQLDAAEAHCRTAIRLAPDNPVIQGNMGAIKKDAGDFAGASQAFKKALEMAPDNAGLWVNLAITSHAMGNVEEAADGYRRAVELDPKNITALTNLGKLLVHLKQPREADACFHRAVGLSPRSPAEFEALGGAFSELGMSEEALAAYRTGCKLTPNDPAPHFKLADCLKRLGQWEESLELHDRVLELTPEAQDVRISKASLLHDMRRTEEGYAQLQPLLEAADPPVPAGIVFAQMSQALGRKDEALTLVERLLATEKPGWEERQKLLFAAGHLHDGQGDYEKAFERFQEGNRIVQEAAYPESHIFDVDRIITAYSRERLSALPRAAAGDERPVFVIGMPRSGTSLVEQILSSHPRVFGGGEMREIQNIAGHLPATLGVEREYPECIEGLNQDVLDRLHRTHADALLKLDPEADRVVDKMPHNFLFLGLIALLYPEAKVIHCIRNPIDTCLSIYFQSFVPQQHPYAFDLTRLGNHYRDYKRLMAHWRDVLDIAVLEVHYEQMVSEQEATSRGMIDFVGLKWDDACLDFHNTVRAVKTASKEQVRQPIYKRSVERWRRYEKHLGPLIEALGEDAGPVPR